VATMTTRRHWRSYGDEPLPTGAEALAEPFTSWFLRIECDRCGKVTMLNEAHTSGRRREISLRALLARMRHDGCGGRPGRAELLTGIERASSRPVRRLLAPSPSRALALLSSRYLGRRAGSRRMGVQQNSPICMSP
jgi:hypothetical protein